MKVCGAQLRGQPGRYCQKPPVKGRDRCRLHGGASLVGPASPSWQTGRYSRYLKIGLRDRYQAALSDPDMASLRSEIALVEARITQLLDDVGHTGNIRLWRAARETLDKMAAVDRSSPRAEAQMGALLQTLDRTIAEGLTEAATWEALVAQIDLRRRLVDSETKRLKDTFQLIAVDRAVQALGLLVETVKTHVSDPRALAAINAEFVRLVGEGDRTAPAT